MLYYAQTATHSKDLKKIAGSIADKAIKEIKAQRNKSQTKPSLA